MDVLFIYFTMAPEPILIVFDNASPGREMSPVIKANPRQASEKLCSFRQR